MNGTDERPAEGAAEVSFQALPTKARHRTSAPSDSEIYGAIEAVRRIHGRKPSADLVIFAAFRLAGASALAAEIERIKTERFPAQ